uniref:Glutamine-rich protein 2-like n=3 Tax=Callorhinchus milii TaxID=7868 RepID=A0A4W3GBU9_CALMI
MLTQRVADIEKNLGNVDVMNLKAMLKEYRQQKERELKEKHQKYRIEMGKKQGRARDQKGGQERESERAGRRARGKAGAQEGREGEESEDEDEEGETDRMRDDILDGKSTDDVKTQIAHLRVTVKHIADELNGLRKMQEQETASGAVLQQQMDKLGPVLEKIMGSSCALLGMSLGFETDGTCPVCSLDVSKDASNLCQRFQALQETVNSIMDNQGDGVQDLGLRSRVQNSILELYGECEKLNQMAGQLLEDDQQQQKKIEHLFETVGRLEERKVDRDEGSTETRVSRAQFDAVTDQMNRMIQGLLHKICSQEKDWGKILEKLSSEMERKLDRIELDPLKKQLENRWKSIHRQLQRRGTDSEAAAGLKRQLINHFHCLSCDRPLDLKSQCATSPTSMPIPVTPGQCYRSQRLSGPFEMQYGRHRQR